MAEYLCEEDMNTGEYISRDEALKIFHQGCDNCTSSYNGVMCRACADADAMDILVDIPAADVQPTNQWISVDDRLPEAVEEDVNCKFYKTEKMFSDDKDRAIERCRAKGSCDNCKYRNLPCKLSREDRGIIFREEEY